MIIRIERYFNYPDLKRQTPQCSMVWKDFTFTEEPVAECDYLVILDYPKADFSVRVNPKNILHLCLEPPNEISLYRQYANKQTALNFNQFDTQKNNVLSHGALPWHLDRNYDFLKNLKPADLEKQNRIAWITSNQRSSKGHHGRMQFFDAIRDLDFTDLFGRGIQPVDDKFEVLKNYKYAIAYENFSNDHYWTEKIIDCFLSYTMPLYFGSGSMGNFFPQDAFIRLDPTDKHIGLFLQEVVHSGQWEQSLDAIARARSLVLDQYQLFPFLYNQIQSLESINGIYRKEHRETVFINGGNAYFDNYPLILDVRKFMDKATGKISKTIGLKK